MVEFAMFPTDKGESISAYVSRIIKIIDDSDINYTLTPMGTIFEVETIEEALEVITQSYKALEKDCNRIYSSIKIDGRKGKSRRFKQKIESIEKRIGKIKSI